jgi:hypothetical protein
MPSAMIPVRIRHTLKSFYFGVNMFNDNPFACKSGIIKLLPFSQFMILACFYGNPAIHVKVFYPEIPKVRMYQDGFVNRWANGVLKYLEIVDAAFRFLDIQDFFAFPVDDYLRLYRMTLLFP